MSARDINIELLLGKRIFSLNGHPIGRLADVKAELRQGRCFVSEFHVGQYAVFERLAALHIGRAILQLFRARKKPGGYRIRWDQLDFSSPEKPRLLCEVRELEPLIDS
jgi:sporulation protein YlmC with PRC-barrel domain